MPDEPSKRRSPFADVAPALATYTDDILFGDVWKRPGLSPRDRSLITVATLIALYRTNELPFHLKFALKNGVTREELTEAMTHLAFYAGWPPASTAVAVARQIFEEEGVQPPTSAERMTGVEAPRAEGGAGMSDAPGTVKKNR